MPQAGQQKRRVLCSLPSGEGSLTPWGLGLSCSLHQPASTGSSKKEQAARQLLRGFQESPAARPCPCRGGLGCLRAVQRQERSWCTGTDGTWSACTSLGRAEAGHSVQSAHHQEGSLEAIQLTKPVLNMGFLLAGPTGTRTTRDTQKQSNTPSWQRLLQTAPALHRFCKRGHD